MKICHLISSLDTGYGGPVIALEGLSRGLLKTDDITLHVVSSGVNHGGQSLEENFRQRGIGVTSGALSVDRRKELIQEADLFHFHGVWDPAFHPFISSCQQFDKPYVVRACGMLDPWSLRQKRWKKLFYRLVRLNGHLHNAAAIHFTTDSEAQLANRFCRPEQRLVEPNGVFLSDFDSHPTPSLRHRWDIPSDHSMALFLGRLHPKKGIEFLLHALKQLPKLGIQLIIAGDGEAAYVSHLKALAANDPRVQFVGMLNGEIRRQALATADFFVLTSYQENFGNAVVEALASGTPVMISPGVNLANVISEHRVGEVVPLDNDSILAALENWGQNPSLIADYSTRCRSTAGDLFDWAEIGKRWRGHYRELTSS